MKFRVTFFAVLALLFAGSTSYAVVVTSYDIDKARLSGFGGWAHTYDGTITSNGDGTYDYSGGSGTINDSVIGTTHRYTHLFYTSDSPAVTLYLDAAVGINEISSTVLDLSLVYVQW